MEKKLNINYLLLVSLLMVSASSAYAGCFANVTPSSPTTNFVDVGNGTVRDNKSGLLWKRCSEGQIWNGTTCTGVATTYTWQGALQQAQALNAGGGFAGATNWRVPNQKELNSIVERQCWAPSINATIFPATVTNYYWSSSPTAGYASSAWGVTFFDGNDNSANFKGSAYPVRLVRGGQ